MRSFAYTPVHYLILTLNRVKLKCSLFQLEPRRSAILACDSFPHHTEEKEVPSGIYENHSPFIDKES